MLLSMHRSRGNKQSCIHRQEKRRIHVCCVHCLCFSASLPDLEVEGFTVSSDQAAPPAATMSIRSWSDLYFPLAQLLLPSAKIPFSVFGQPGSSQTLEVVPCMFEAFCYQPATSRSVQGDTYSCCRQPFAFTSDF